MTSNSSLFSTFQSQSSPSTVTLADGSQSCVLGLGTIFPTPSIPLSSVLSLPNFSFNLISVSKLTRVVLSLHNCSFNLVSVSKLTQALKCCVSFFLEYCLFQDLMTKQIIGRGRESRGLYILDPVIPRPIACSGVFTFVDDYSRTTWLYLMKNRSELFSHFQAFCAKIKTQFHTSAQNLRIDNAKEYLSEQFQKFML